MKKNIFFNLIFLLFFASIALAQTSIKAEIDKKRITTDEFIIYKITLACEQKISPQLELPKFSDFSVVSQAQASKTSISKDKIEVNIVYTYILAPHGIGKFKIGPSKIKINKSIISSEAFDVEVIQGKNKLLPKFQEIPNIPASPESSSSQLQVTL